jgi:hypothetical protein
LVAGLLNRTYLVTLFAHVGDGWLQRATLVLFGDVLSYESAYLIVQPGRALRLGRTAVTPRFSLGLFNTNDRVNQVKHVDLVEHWSSWAITSKT